MYFVFRVDQGPEWTFTGLPVSGCYAADCFSKRDKEAWPLTFRQSCGSLLGGVNLARVSLTLVSMTFVDHHSA